MNHDLDIVIPVWNQAALTIACLRSIGEYTSRYRIVLVDNGSEPEAFAAIEAELRNHPHVLLRNRENVGFVRATNRGICQCDAPLVVLMNNDTEAVPGWIAKLREPLEDPRIGAVGPLTTTPQSWQGRWPRGDGWHLLGTHQMLAFFCTLFRREVFERVGLLDEDFGIGFGDDDDYCARMHEAGWRLALAQDLVIPHHHRTSFRVRFTDDELVGMQDRARALAKEKARLRAEAAPPPEVPRAVTLRAEPDTYPEGLFDRLLWLASQLQTLPELPAFVPSTDPWGLATELMLQEIVGVELERLTVRPVEELLEAPDLPGVLLMGRFLPYEPTARMAEVGRECMSAIYDVPLPVIREFLEARGVALPPQAAVEQGETR